MAPLRARIHCLGALVTILSGTTLASPANDFHTLLDEHWATVEREQVFFLSDPDAFRMNGQLPSFSHEAYARREKASSATARSAMAIRKSASFTINYLIVNPRVAPPGGIRGNTCTAASFEFAHNIHGDRLDIRRGRGKRIPG